MRIKVGSIVVCVFLVTSIAIAQGIAGGRGQGRGISNYDPKTETTVNGVVQDVQQQSGRRGNSGTHALVKTQKGVLDVHVGPTSFLSKEGLSLEKGDSLEIIGSKVTVDGKEVFIAREVRKAGKNYVLRDSAGKPMWSGAKR